MYGFFGTKHNTCLPPRTMKQTKSEIDKVIIGHGIPSGGKQSALVLSHRTRHAWKKKGAKK